MTTVRSLDARLIRVPLARPWGPDVTAVSVIETHLVRSDGAEGWGFSWTPQIGAEAVLAMLRHDIATAAAGLSAEPAAAWQSLWEHLHEAGGGGITTIALAGLDLAIWDAAARADGRPVGALLTARTGNRRDSVRAYGSGVNLHYPVDELVAQAGRWRDAGFAAVKVKVGRPDLAEDVERIAAVRETLGPDADLMIDANQRWDLERATRAVEALAPYDLAWIEEPLRADDLPGHAELARRIDVPIALGENLHTVHRFADALRSGAAQIVQPNVVRVGGITPFLRIAGLAADHGVALHPHLLPELSGQLALALPSVSGVAEPMVEDIEDAGFAALGALADPSPVAIADGRLTEVPHLGVGIRFRSNPRLEYP